MYIMCVYVYMGDLFVLAGMSGCIYASVSECLLLWGVWVCCGWFDEKDVVVGLAW
jgi:hypothetical protein